MNTLIFIILLSYATSFSGMENPLSEGGRWHHANNAWLKVQKKGGLAMTTGINFSYDDAYSLLSGYPANQVGRAKVVVRPDRDCSCSHEVEVLLRMTDGADFVRGYEVYMSCPNISSGDSDVQIVRWNGAMGDFSLLSGGVARGSAAGGVLTAKVIGSQIDALWNGQLVATATDGMHTSGQPGIGFFRRDCGHEDDVTMTHYTAKGL
jgi:hypothetical protein